MSLLYQLWRNPALPFVFMMPNPEGGKIVFHFECKGDLGEIWIIAVKASIGQAISLTWLAKASSCPR